MIIYILIPCLFCAVVIANSTVRIKRLLNILTIGTLVILIVSLPQFEEVARLNKQVTVFGSTYFGVGRFAGIGVVIALIGALRATSIFSVLSHVLFLLLSTLVLLLSGSRTPFFAIALLIPLVFIGSWNLPNLLRKAINRRILFASGLLVILVFGSLTLAPYLSSKGYYILTFHRILALKDNASAKIRYSWSKTVVQEMYISSALRKWTGYGLGSWPVSSIRPGQNYFRENYPYNIVFETFFELGILGLVLFMVLLSKLKVHLYWNQLRRDPYKFMIIALLIFFFINSLIFNDLPGNRVLFVMIVLTTAISDSIGS
jgi:O-antigen ligase